jgi:hypothetical protein
MGGDKQRWNEWRELDVERITLTTDKALLVVLDGGPETWLPRSQVRDGETYQAGNVALTLAVKEWVARRAQEDPVGLNVADVAAEALAGGVPAAALAYNVPTARKLVAVCESLARRWRDRPFPLPYGRVAFAIGVSRDTVKVWVRRLVKDGVLEPAERSVWERGCPGRTGKPTFYRYRPADRAAA